MPCTECYDNVWICGTDTPKCDDLPPSLDDFLAAGPCGNRWCYADCVEMSASATYDLYFNPSAGEGGNCSAQLVKQGDPKPTSPWRVVGTRTLGPGIFALWCKKGSAGGGGGDLPFKVAVKAVMECP
jgi:hypothetical protein